MIEDVFYFHAFLVMFTFSCRSTGVDISPQTRVLSGLVFYESKTQISFQVRVFERQDFLTSVWIEADR